MQTNKKFNINELLAIPLWDKRKNPKITGYTKNNKEAFIPRGLIEEQNVGVGTGIRNRLCVADLDFLGVPEREWSDTAKKFVETFGHPDELWLKWDTRIIMTSVNPNKYHIYIPYDDDIKYSTKADGIDILSEMTFNHKPFGYVVAEGSVVTKNGIDQTYRCINDTDIKPIPELKQFIIDVIYAKKQPQIQPLSQVDNEPNELQYFNIPNHIVKRIANKIKKSEWENTKKWKELTIFFKMINQKQIWNEYSKKFNGYNERRNRQIWNENRLSIFSNVAKMIMRKYFKKIDLKADVYMFKPRNIFTKKADYTINRKYLFDNGTHKDPFSNPKKFCKFLKKNKIVIFKSDTGTGKTTMAILTLKELGDKYRMFSVVSRVSLFKDQYKRFNEDGVDVYGYEDFLYSNNSGFVIQADSLNTHFKFNKKGELVTKCDDTKVKTNDLVLYLDETASNIIHTATSGTAVKNCRIQTQDILLYLVKHCKNTIGTDADINDVVFDYISECNEDVCYVENKFKNYRDIDAVEINEYGKIVELLINQDKAIVPCDTRKIAQDIAMRYELSKNPNATEKYLKKTFGDNGTGIGEHCVLFTGTTTNKKYNFDDYDVVIYSPCVIYGVDSVMERIVFCFFSGKSLITALAQKQMLCRCRNIKKLYFFYEDKHYITPKYKSVQDAYDTMLQRNRQILNSDYEMPNSTQCYMNNISSNQHYFNIASKIEYDLDCLNTNKFYYFIDILKNSGFTLKDDDTINEYKQMEVIPDIKDVTNEELLCVLNTILQNDKVKDLFNIDLETFKDMLEQQPYNLTISMLFNKKEWVKQLINFKGVFYDDINKVMKSIDESGEAVCNKPKSAKYKVVLLKELFKVLDINPYISLNFKSTGLDKDTAIEIIKKWQTSYNKDVTYNLTTRQGIDGILKFAYRGLGLTDAINWKRERPRDDNDNQIRHTIYDYQLFKPVMDTYSYLLFNEPYRQECRFIDDD